jgi:hypothetical protein
MTLPIVPLTLFAIIFVSVGCFFFPETISFWAELSVLLSMMCLSTWCFIDLLRSLNEDDEAL